MIEKVLLLQNKELAGWRAERIRKNVKAAFVDGNIPYTDNIAEPDFQIAHLLFPFTGEEIDQLIADNKKIVASVCYSETDENSAFTNIATCMDEDKMDIENSRINSLLKVDKVLVPCEEYFNLLVQNGIDPQKISILSPGINNQIYRYLTEEDMTLAKKYFKIDENTKMLVAFGNYKDKACLDRIHEIAKLRPDCVIVFLGTNTIEESIFKKIKDKINKNYLPNVIYARFVDINVYRSLLKNVRAVLLLNSYLTDEVQILEAFAAECQVIAYDKAIPQALRNSLVIHSDDEKDIYKMLSNFLDYKISNTISKEHFYVTERDVSVIGEKLNEIYSSVLKEE